MNQTTRRRRRVWNKDDVPRMAAAAPHASVAPTPAAPATPHGDVPKITPKSRDLVRRMLQAERRHLQPPPSPKPAHRGFTGHPKAALTAGSGILRRIVGKSPDPRRKSQFGTPGAEASGVMAQTPDARPGGIFRRLIGKSPDPRKSPAPSFLGTPEPRLTRRICGKSPDPRRRSPGGTPHCLTHRILGKSPDPRGRSRSPRRLSFNTPQAAVRSRETPQRGSYEEVPSSPERSEMTPLHTRHASRSKVWSPRSEDSAEKEADERRRAKTPKSKARSPTPQRKERPSETRSKSVEVRGKSAAPVSKDLPLVPLSVVNADAMRRAILAPRQAKRPYRPFTALQAMATQSQDPDDDDDALARQILNEMRRERQDFSSWLRR
eukprot:symbB.v1.2.016200.t1/scaffold1218.1/size131101/7